MTEKQKAFEEIKKAKEDAIRKLKEIQKRSAYPTKEHVNVENKDKIHKNSKNPNFIENIFSLLFKDQDRTLILALIILLMDNEENFTIIMLLIYLLI